MNHKLQDYLASHPLVAYVTSAAAGTSGLLAGLKEYATTLGHVAGACAALFGMVAAYFTMRSQHREWKRGATRPPFPVGRD